MTSEQIEGEFAIVEMLGHSTLVGRISEVERFGAKLCQIEPIYKGELLPPVLVGGASIYRITPCNADVAFRKAPAADYLLPAPVRARLPVEALPKPAEPDPDFAEVEELF